MASVKLPDGKQLEIEPGEKARDVAEKIGKRLARDAVVAKLDGELIDLDAPLNGGGVFEVVTKDSSEGLEVLRHSTAHAMAQAIVELYPGSRLTLGPPIENRSEEHTSELQSRQYLVCRLLLEKKKNEHMT